MKIALLRGHAGQGLLHQKCQEFLRSLFPSSNHRRMNTFNPFNSNFNFMPCRLHPASNGNAISESHPEYEGHAHITSLQLRHYNYVIPRTKWRLERSTAPYSSYTAAPRRTAPGPSNRCPSYLTTLVTIHSSYGCLVKKKE